MDFGLFSDLRLQTLDFDLCRVELLTAHFATAERQMHGHQRNVDFSIGRSASSNHHYIANTRVSEVTLTIGKSARTTEPLRRLGHNFI